MSFPESVLTSRLAALIPGNALDLACGSGRNAIWLDEHGWQVTAVDLTPGYLPKGIHQRVADLEKHEFKIEPNCWELIVCWLYWQADLLPEIAAGVRSGGIAALCGKTEGRFATSLANYRSAFPGWEELVSGENSERAWVLFRKP